MEICGILIDLITKIVSTKDGLGLVFIADSNKIGVLKMGGYQNTAVVICHRIEKSGKTVILVKEATPLGKATEVEVELKLVYEGLENIANGDRKPDTDS